MLEKTIKKESSSLRLVPNDLTFLEMCEKVVKDVPWRLECVPIGPNI